MVVTTISVSIWLMHRLQNAESTHEALPQENAVEERSLVTTW
jgi:hypothetical protein